MPLLPHRSPDGLQLTQQWAARSHPPQDGPEGPDPHLPRSTLNSSIYIKLPPTLVTHADPGLASGIQLRSASSWTTTISTATTPRSQGHGTLRPLFDHGAQPGHWGRGKAVKRPCFAATLWNHQAQIRVNLPDVYALPEPCRPALLDQSGRSVATKPTNGGLV